MIPPDLSKFDNMFFRNRFFIQKKSVFLNFKNKVN